MPEAVHAWFQRQESSILERVQAVTQIHSDLVAGYQRDFGKYAGKTDTSLIEAVFRIVPIEVKSGKRTRAKSLQSYIDTLSCHVDGIDIICCRSWKQKTSWPHASAQAVIHPRWHGRKGGAAKTGTGITLRPWYSGMCAR